MSTVKDQMKPTGMGGAYQVGSSEYGTPPKLLLSKEEEEDLKDKLTKHITSSGGVTMNTETKGIKKKMRKKLISEPKQTPEPTQTPEATVIAEPEQKKSNTGRKTQRVKLKGSFGQCKLQPVEVLVNDLGILLIFDNVDDIVFEPNGGDKLFLEWEDEYQVMYPDLLFESDKQAYMSFIRLDVEK